MRPERWRGIAVLITSGPTREYLDPVRFLTNESSGRMGRELAAAALRLGAEVTVVTGPSEVPPPPGATVVRVLTAEAMRRETLRRVPSADVVIGAAAVADWRFASPSRRKLKRGGSPLRLTLEPNPDIIKQAASRARRLRTAWRSCGTGRKENVRARRADGRRRAPPGVPDALRRRAKGGRPRPVVAGFALETCRRVAAAREKLGRKGLDLVVANGPESLGSDRARFDIVTRDRVIRLGVLAKREAAERVLGEIGVMLRSQH